MPQTATHSLTAPFRSSSGRIPRRVRRPARSLPSRPLRLHQEVSFGGIIFRRRSGHVEIFFIKDSYQRWTFPKGHQERGETPVQTAVREIREETGLINLRFVAPVGRTQFRFHRESRAIEKAVHFFLFEAPADVKEKMMGEHGMWEGEWVKADDAFHKSGYHNLDRLLAKAMRLIAQHEQTERYRR